MIVIACDAKRLAAAKVEGLIAVAGLHAEARWLDAAGYALQPVGAPKELDGGGVRFRLTWRRRNGTLVSLVRHTVTLRAAADL